MLVTADARDPLATRTDLLVIPVTASGDAEHLPGRLSALNRALGDGVSAAVASGDFRGKRDQRLLLYPDGALPAKRVLLLGLGDEGRVDADALRRAGGAGVREGATRKAAKVTVAVARRRRVRTAAAAQALAEGAVLGRYRFDTYKQKAKDAPGEVAAVQLSFDTGADLRGARAGVKRGVVLAESQNLARDLSNAPGNALPPAQLAREAQKVAKEVGLLARVLGVAELRKRKMGAILAVGGGSIILADEIPGASEILRPANHDVANAIGAAIADHDNFKEKSERWNLELFVYKLVQDNHLQSMMIIAEYLTRNHVREEEVPY